MSNPDREDRIIRAVLTIVVIIIFIRICDMALS
jgi:hypothetical protein